MTRIVRILRPDGGYYTDIFRLHHGRHYYSRFAWYLDKEALKVQAARFAAWHGYDDTALKIAS